MLYVLTLISVVVAAVVVKETLSLSKKVNNNVVTVNNLYQETQSFNNRISVDFAETSNALNLLTKDANRLEKSIFSFEDTTLGTNNKLPKVANE